MTPCLIQALLASWPQLILVSLCSLPSKLSAHLPFFFFDFHKHSKVFPTSWIWDLRLLPVKVLPLCDPFSLCHRLSVTFHSTLFFPSQHFSWYVIICVCLLVNYWLVLNILDYKLPEGRTHVLSLFPPSHTEPSTFRGTLRIWMSAWTNLAVSAPVQLLSISNAAFALTPFTWTIGSCFQTDGSNLLSPLQSFPIAFRKRYLEGKRGRGIW